MGFQIRRGSTRGVAFQLERGFQQEEGVPTRGREFQLEGGILEGGMWFQLEEWGYN